MVKDRVSMSDHQLVIVPELFIDQPVNLAAILTMTYSVILELIQEQTTVRLLYWSTNRYEYEDVRIDYKEELDAAFTRFIMRRHIRIRVKRQIIWHWCTRKCMHICMYLVMDRVRRCRCGKMSRL